MHIFSFLLKDIYLLNPWVISEAFCNWPTDMSPSKGSQKEQKEMTIEDLSYRADLKGTSKISKVK